MPIDGALFNSVALTERVWRVVKCLVWREALDSDERKKNNIWTAEEGQNGYKQVDITLTWP